MARFKVHRRVGDVSRGRPGAAQPPADPEDENTLPVDPAAERSFNRGCLGCSTAFALMLLFLAGSLLFNRCGR